MICFLIDGSNKAHFEVLPEDPDGFTGDELRRALVLELDNRNLKVIAIRSIGGHTGSRVDPSQFNLVGAYTILFPRLYHVTLPRNLDSIYQWGLLAGGGQINARREIFFSCEHTT